MRLKKNGVDSFAEQSVYLVCLQKDLAEHTTMLKKQKGKLYHGTPSSSERQ